MCKSLADGGQRCYSHAKQRVDRALAQLAALESSHSGNPGRAPSPADPAHFDYIEAVTDLTSTSRGAADVRTLSVQGQLRPDVADAALRDGEWRRHRNRLVRHVRKHGDARPLVPRTGDARLDLLIDDAVDSVVADPSAHGVALDDVTWLGLTASMSGSSADRETVLRRIALTVEDEAGRLNRAAALLHEVSRRPPGSATPREAAFAERETARARAKVSSAKSSVAFWRTQLVRAALAEA